MKYEPKMVFVIEDGGYKGLTYQEYCARCIEEPSYQDKLFYPMHGVLMEVPREVYREFYREDRRQKYINERSKAHGDLSLDMPIGEGLALKDVVADPEADVEAQAIKNEFKRKLLEVMLHLSREEIELLWLRYEMGFSEKKLGEIYALSQQGISKRLRRILKKIVKSME